MSVDAACTAIVGKAAPIAPTCIQVSGITSTSAIISWLPSNSNYQHIVYIDDVEVRMFKQGAFRHTVTGLSPNVHYRAMVKASCSNSAKDSKDSHDVKNDSISIDFCTMPKGLPDPPLDVQVELGHENGTLLISWLPVTINTSGTSNGSQVTGYSVYGNENKIVDIDNPTSDHVIIEANKLSSITYLTVRTKSNDIVSSDSVQVQVSGLIDKCNLELREKLSLVNKCDKDNIIEETLKLSDCIETKEQKEEEGSGKSELSDIAEEAEDELTDSQNSSKNEVFLKTESLGVMEERREEKLKIMSRTFKKVKKTIKTTDTRRPSGIPVFNSSNRKSERRNSQVSVSTDSNGSDEDAYSLSPKFNVPMKITSSWKNSVDYLQKASTEKKQKRQRTEEKRRTKQSRSDLAEIAQSKTSVDDKLPLAYSIRTFEALFDYDPSTMSPNPGAFMDELPFREGQIIRVYGDKDPDGFYWGEVDGRQGLVPCNMVLEIPEESDEEYNKKKVKSSWSKSSYKFQNRSSRSNSDEMDEWKSDDHTILVKKMVALYDYDPQKLSPNDDAEVELTFNAGDIIYVYGNMDEDGFYMGQIKEVCGLVPSNFLKEVLDDTFGKDPNSTSMCKRLERQNERQTSKNLSRSCGIAKPDLHKNGGHQSKW
ncbi:hypothetical protein CHUAL_013848 [Chamberlinius hualienensis]